MIILSDSEKTLFEAWVKENISADIIPSDDLNDEAWVFNLVHLIRGDGQEFGYEDEQLTEIESWHLYGR